MPSLVGRPAGCGVKGESYRILLKFMLTVVLFLGSAAAIYFACEYFVNGVEWLGRKLGVGETATGTILAAFGTALPESAVTFVAVVFGRGSAPADIGVGAARSEEHTSE